MTPFVSGRIYCYLADDHSRIDDALQRATRRPETIAPDAYAEFRAGLLRHIGLEEKILLPATRVARGGEPLPIASKLRLDHGALTALLVPTPTPAIVAVIRAILERHNPLEESPGGVYEQCEQLAGAQGDEILKRLKTAPAVTRRQSFRHGSGSPELTRSATQEQVAELGQEQFDRYVCSNRTCEIGMNLATGKNYRSVILLLEELTRSISQ